MSFTVVCYNFQRYIRIIKGLVKCKKGCQIFNKVMHQIRNVPCSTVGAFSVNVKLRVIFGNLLFKL